MASPGVLAQVRYICLADRMHARSALGASRAASTPVLARWLASSWVKPCFCADETFAARARGATRRLPRRSAPGSSARSARAAIDRLYAHQAQRLRGRRRRRATSSSRRRPRAARASASTCPCSRRSRDDPDARAIYLFPTKALARDQEAGLRELMRASGLDPGAVVYDGDTPGDARRAARERSAHRPDQPGHAAHRHPAAPHRAGRGRSQNLRYVVVDELHTYRGVFGSHVANVLARLAARRALSRLATRCSSARRRPSATRASTRRASSACREDEVDARRRERRAARRAALLPLQPARRERGARHPRELREAGGDARRRSRARQRADDRLRPVAQQRRGDAQVPARRARATTQHRPDAHHGLPRRLPARSSGASIEQRPARRRDPLRRRDQRARARHRHRRARRGRLRRLPGLGRRRRGSASAAPGGAAATSICVLVASSAPLDQYLAREPELPARRARRGGAHRSGQRRDPRPAPQVRGVRAAVQARRGVRRRSAPTRPRDALGFLAQPRRAARVARHASTGRPTRTRRTTCRCAASAGTTSSSSTSSTTGRIAELDWRGAHTMLHEQAIYQHDGEQ